LNRERPADIFGKLYFDFAYLSEERKNLRLTIRHFSKAYGFVWALRDIDLDLCEGECVALLGPNGAGKTTLLKTLCGVLRPTAGEVRVDGASLPPAHSSRAPAIGVLSPSDHLYEKLTAAENLRLFLALYDRREKRREIPAALAAVGLNDWSGEFAGSLSSGMKCRLSIAKWMLLEPELLLVDEPYGVLDGGGVDLLEAHLKDICRRGGIVVMATHHVTRAVALCSRAVILRQGKKILDETKRKPWDSLHRAVGEFLPRGEAWPS
jgi:heme ABC exporter ATP-binding subunit CcmA